MTKQVEIKIVDASLRRLPCTVCGGCTEKHYVACEGHDESYNFIRVCETCLEQQEIDTRLQEHAAAVEQEAAWLRGLVGRLKTPSFAEWQAADQAADEALAEEYERQDAELAEVLAEKKRIGCLSPGEDEWLRRRLEVADAHQGGAA